jgi:hypothetical protein
MQLQMPSSQSNYHTELIHDNATRLINQHRMTCMHKDIHNPGQT